MRSTHTSSGKAIDDASEDSSAIALTNVTLEPCVRRWLATAAAKREAEDGVEGRDSTTSVERPDSSRRPATSPACVVARRVSSGARARSSLGVLIRRRPAPASSAASPPSSTPPTPPRAAETAGEAPAAA